MPVNEVRQICNNTILGTWVITESWEDLYGAAQLSADELTLFSAFKNDGRKRQWLAYRMLIREMLGEQYVMVYDDDGRPHISEPWHFVSVSHSKNMAAVLVSRDKAVGIDIEMIHPRIEKVISKFLSADEIKSLDTRNRLQKMFVYWCGKEALYKLDGKGAADFSKQILFGHFEYTSPGHLPGSIIKEDNTRSFDVHFEEIDGYMLAYATE